MKLAFKIICYIFIKNIKSVLLTSMFLYENKYYNYLILLGVR